jgi:SET domain-containing protein
MGVKMKNKSKPRQKMPHETVYARIQPSKIHGVGVFAIRDIPKGTRLFPEDDVELVWRKRDALKLGELPKEVRELYDQFCLIKDRGETYGCPKSFNLMTTAWYLNHSADPNVGCDKDYSFFALRDIRQAEELTADYRTYNEFASADWI